jgi:hypothetical protein
MEGGAGRSLPGFCWCARRTARARAAAGAMGVPAGGDSRGAAGMHRASHGRAGGHAGGASRVPAGKLAGRRARRPLPALLRTPRAGGGAAGPNGGAAARPPARGAGIGGLGEMVMVQPLVGRGRGARRLCTCPTPGRRQACPGASLEGAALRWAAAGQPRAGPERPPRGYCGVWGLVRGQNLGARAITASAGRRGRSPFAAATSGCSPRGTCARTAGCTAPGPRQTPPGTRCT